MKKVLLLLSIFMTVVTACSPQATPTLPPEPVTYIVAPLTASLAVASFADFGTIQECVEFAKPGEICAVRDGVYEEEVVIAHAGITLVAEGAVVKNVFVTADNVTVGPGLTISGSTSFCVTTTAKNTRILDNIISDCLRDGILTYPSSSGAIIKGNTVVRASQSAMEIRGTGHLIEGNDVSKTIQYPDLMPNGIGDGSDADCFRPFGSGHIFKGNYCHDISFGRQDNLPGQNSGMNVDPHIDCFQSWRDLGRGLLHDTIFDGNTCVLLDGQGSKSFQAEGGQYNLTFRHNVFHTDNGFNLTGSSSSASIPSHDFLIEFNTFVGHKENPATWGINGSIAQRIVVENNVFAWHVNGAGHLRGAGVTASGNCVWKQGGNRPPDPGEIRKDPLFVNEIAKDFHLKPTSPCLNKGAYAGLGIPATQTASAAPLTFTHTNTPIRTVTPTIQPTNSRTQTITVPSATPTVTLTKAPTGSITPVTPTLTRTPTVIPFTKTPTTVVTVTPTPPFNSCDYNKNGRIDGFWEWLCTRFSR